MAEVELPDPEELREQGEDRLRRRVALVTAVFAVILAMASLGGSNAMKEILLAQQKSSDQWAFYQAKVIREHLYRAQKMRLEAELLERGGAVRPAPRAARGAGQEVARGGEALQRRKKDIEKDAKRLEAVRDLSATRDPYVDLAEVLLQIAIVISSVSILSKSRPVFYFSYSSPSSGPR